MSHPLYSLLVGLVDSYRTGRISPEDLEAGLEVMLERLERWSAELSDPTLAPAGELLERQKRGVQRLTEAVEAVQRFACGGPGERLEVALLEAQHALAELEA